MRSAVSSKFDDCETKLILEICTCSAVLIAYIQKREKNVGHTLEQTRECNLECIVQDHIPSGKN